MGIFKRFKPNANGAEQGSSAPETFSENQDKEKDTQHAETAASTGVSRRFKLNKAGEGDVALALFSRPEDVDEPIDPVEEKKVVRKIDFMILPVRISRLIRLRMVVTNICISVYCCLLCVSLSNAIGCFPKSR